MNKIDAILKPLSPDYVGAYLNSGIQLYELIEWALQQTGKSDITIMTFSISEEFIRKVWILKEMNLIGKTTLIIDFKAIQKTQQLVRFSENVFSDIHFSRTHAKVVLIESKTFLVSITGSQNATRGNRVESGIVSTDPEIYKKLETEIQHIVKNGIHRG